MSTLNGSVYRKSESRSVYSESQYPERSNGYAVPKQAMPYLDAPRAPSRARSQNSGMNYLEVPRAPSRARSPNTASGSEVTAVDPTLEDAQKAGNNYHITMSLNAALADAGLPASVAMATTTGRASQMGEYATNSRSQMGEYATNSRSQMGEYATNSRSQTGEYAPGSRSVSRVGVYANDGPVPAPRLHLDHGSRNGAVSVIQVDGYETRGQTASPYVVGSQRDTINTTTNDGYTIRSVTPSTARKEVHTTVERSSGSNTVGFDLQLIGGQTTTIKETVDSGSRSGLAKLPKSTRGRNEGSLETTYTKHSHHGSDDRGYPSNAGKTKKQKPENRGMDSPDLGTMIDDEDLRLVEFTNRKPDSGMLGVGTKRGYDPSGRPNAGTIGRGMKTTNSYGPTDADTRVQRHTEVTASQDRRNPWLLRGDGDDGGTDESWAIYRQLVKGAGPGTVQQRVTVEQDEDDIVEDGPRIKDMLNVDTVSEKVLVFVGNSIAEMTIKVRTERIVPIKGSNNMFRKSAVTVNRIIEVDMMATHERQRIYENVIDRQRTSGRDLNQKETFDLYKAFLRLAEEDEGNATRDQVRIDKTTDEAQLEDLKRASNFYEKRDSFDAGSSSNQMQSRGFSSTSRSASRSASNYRDSSRFHEHGNDDSEVSSAIF